MLCLMLSDVRGGGVGDGVCGGVSGGEVCDKVKYLVLCCFGILMTD